MFRGFEARRWRSSHLNHRRWSRGFVTGLTALLEQRMGGHAVSGHPTLKGTVATMRTGLGF